MTNRTEFLKSVPNALCDAIASAGRDGIVQIMQGYKQESAYRVLPQDSAQEQARKQALGRSMDAQIERAKKMTPEQVLRVRNYQDLTKFISSEELGKILDQQGIWHSGWLSGFRTPHQAVEAQPAHCARDVEVHNGIVALKQRFAPSWWNMGR